MAYQRRSWHQNPLAAAMEEELECDGADHSKDIGKHQVGAGTFSTVPRTILEPSPRRIQSPTRRQQFELGNSYLGGNRHGKSRGAAGGGAQRMLDSLRSSRNWGRTAVSPAASPARRRPRQQGRGLLTGSPPRPNLGPNSGVETQGPGWNPGSPGLSERSALWHGGAPDSLARVSPVAAGNGDSFYSSYRHGEHSRSPAREVVSPSPEVDLMDLLERATQAQTTSPERAAALLSQFCV